MPQSLSFPDNPNWNRFKDACPFYRERWIRGEAEDGHGGRLLYQSICLMNTPPETYAEQEKCMAARTKCWRLAEAARAAKSGRKSAAAAAS